MSFILTLNFFTIKVSKDCQCYMTPNNLILNLETLKFMAAIKFILFKIKD